jgi:hypothetical protein
VATRCAGARVPGVGGVAVNAMTELLPFGFDSGATFSPNRKYRYRLWRSWGNREHRCVFVGLNPSKAGEEQNDPTIRKEIGFASRWGFGALDKVNLCGLVSTEPTGLLHVVDPIGPENAALVRVALEGAHRIVWAWGRHNARVARLVRQILAASDWYAIPRRCDVGTLGRNGDGTPRHPLYLPYTTRFERESP